MKNLFSKIKNNAKITGAALLTTIAISGCGNHKQYHFNGKIGNEQVEFSECTLDGCYQTLSVTKKNGTVVAYQDFHGDNLKVDFVRYHNADIDTTYSDQGHLLAAQADFDEYLQKILEVKDSIRKAEEGK